MIFLRNAARAPARTILTVLGVAAGVALFVAIRTITIDIRRQIAAAAGAYELDVVVYERRANSPFTSRLSPEQMRDLQARYRDALAPLVLGTHNAEWNSYALVIGVTETFRDRIPLVSGTRYDEGSGRALLGEVAARRLGIGPGASLTLDGRAVPVSGVFRTGSRMLDGGVMVEIGHAQQIITREGAEPQYTLALLHTRPGETSAGLIRELNDAYPALRAIPGAEFAGALRLMRVVDAFVKTLSVIAILGTVLVVSNTLVMAIAERTREIGILMTIGWRPRLILRMLLAEGTLLCVAGTLAGNLLAVALLRVVNAIESIGFGWIPVHVPTSVALASLAVALGVALVSLSWPAVLVYRMQPLAAVRHE